MRHSFTLLSVALLATPCAIAQRQTWTVPSGLFPSLQAAVDSPLVAAGDILLLSPGNHGSVTTSKPLLVFGDATTFVAHAVIHDIPAGKEFVLSGMRFYDQTTTTIAGIEVTNSPGRVLVDGASTHVPGSFPQFELRRLVAAAGCADIEVANVTSLGAAVYFASCNATVRGCRLVPAFTNPSADTSSAFTAHQSVVEVVDTSIAARPYTQPSPAARIIDG